MSTPKKRPGVMLYFEHTRPIGTLSFEERGRLFTAILEYGELGVVPDFSDSPVLSFAWVYLKQGLDRDEEKYQTKCEQNRLNRNGGKSSTET